MSSLQSGAETIRVDQFETGPGERRPALVLLHGSGGAVGYWLQRFAPTLTQFGMGLYAPHYFDKTGTARATAETILDGHHFPAWLSAVANAVDYTASRPTVDPDRVAVLGISLGGYLAMALAAQSRRVRAVIELSGGMPPGWEARLGPETPPVLVLHGGRDATVPVSEAHKLGDLLTNRSVEHQVEIFPEETHWFSQAAQPRLLMTCAEFLSRHFGRPRAASAHRT